MNEPPPSGFSPGSPTDSAPADGPRAEQAALLRHFDLLPAEGLSGAAASALIGQLEADPDWQPHLAAWHRDKFELHPDLFAEPPPPAAAPPRPYREARWWQSQITDGSVHGRSLRPPSVAQALAVLETLDRESPGWDRESRPRRAQRFMNALAALAPELRKPGAAFPRALPPGGDDAGETPAFDPGARALPAPFVPDAYAATSEGAAGPDRLAWQPPVQPPTRNPNARPFVPARGGAGKWVLLLLGLAAGAGAYAFFGFRASPPVRQASPESSIINHDLPGGSARQSATVLPTLPAKDSQRRAIERYPDLGKAGTPLNQTFVALVHQLEVERSPRLQQANWPERLADECASALVIAPLGPKVKPAATPAPLPKAAATPAAVPPPLKTAAHPAPTASKTNTPPAPPTVAAAAMGIAPVASAAASATPRPSPGSIFAGYIEDYGMRGDSGSILKQGMKTDGTAQR